jgi:hypothetical protein
MTYQSLNDQYNDFYAKYAYPGEGEGGVVGSNLHNMLSPNSITDPEIAKLPLAKWLKDHPDTKYIDRTGLGQAAQMLGLPFAGDGNPDIVQQTIDRYNMSKLLAGFGFGTTSAPPGGHSLDGGGASSQDINPGGSGGGTKSSDTISSFGGSGSSTGSPGGATSSGNTQGASNDSSAQYDKPQLGSDNADPTKSFGTSSYLGQSSSGANAARDNGTGMDDSFFRGDQYVSQQAGSKMSNYNAGYGGYNENPGSMSDVMSYLSGNPNGDNAARNWLSEAMTGGVSTSGIDPTSPAGMLLGNAGGNNFSNDQGAYGYADPSGYGVTDGAGSFGQGYDSQQDEQNGYGGYGGGYGGYGGSGYNLY